MTRRAQVRAAAELALVLAVAGAAVLVLHRLGSLAYLQINWSDLVGWLGHVRAEDAVVALLRLAALGCGWWVLVSTALYTLARASRVPAALRAVEWAALPPVRRVADRAVAVTLAGSSVLGGPAGVASAQELPVPEPPSNAEEAAQETVEGLEEPRSPEEGHNGHAPAGSEQRATEQPAPRPAPFGGETAPSRGRPAGETGSPADALGKATAPAGEPGASASAADTAQEADDGTPSTRLGGARPTEDEAGSEGEGPAIATHKVQAGEHLWGIAEAHLRATRDHDPTAEDVAAYWRAVVAANADRVASGDPDLIRPGETVVLPHAPDD